MGTSFKDVKKDEIFEMLGIQLCIDRLIPGSLSVALELVPSSALRAPLRSNICRRLEVFWKSSP